MVKIIYAILEVAMIAVPLVVALALLIPSKASYSEKFENSKFRSFGVSETNYRLCMRLMGVVCLIVACFAFYMNYIAEPDATLKPNKEFWEDINRNTSEDLMKLSMLLGAAVAIPARMGSTRFPGKPLALLGGKAVLQRVHEACKKSKYAQKVVILTDSLEILEFAQTIGAQAIKTSEKCKSGTERIVEALPEIDADFIVNVQGDEPFISPKLIDDIIEANRASNSQLVTAVSRITDASALVNPNVVKALRDADGRAIYFSRSPLPYVRGEANFEKWLGKSEYWRHVGIYGYSAKSIVRYANLPPCRMEQAEMLEQLRFVNAGFKFDIVETEYESIGIDTPADLAAAEEFLKNREI